MGCRSVRWHGAESDLLLVCEEEGRGASRPLPPGGLLPERPPFPIGFALQHASNQSTNNIIELLLEWMFDEDRAQSP